MIWFNSLASKNDIANFEKKTCFDENIKTATSNKNELSERIKKKLKQDQQKDQEMIW